MHNLKKGGKSDVWHLFFHVGKTQIIVLKSMNWIVLILLSFSVSTGATCILRSYQPSTGDATGFFRQITSFSPFGFFPSGFFPLGSFPFWIPSLRISTQRNRAKRNYFAWFRSTAPPGLKRLNVREKQELRKENSGQVKKSQVKREVREGKQKEGP